MGTWLALSFAPGSGEHTRLPSIAFDLAAKLDRRMSRHDAGSDLSRVNRRAGTAGSLRAPELARILRLATRFCRRLDGAFDPTIGPLVDLWRSAATSGRRPSQRALDEARARVGPGVLRIAGDRVALARKGAALDLDGFGKGLALDRIAAALRHACAGPGILNFGESSLIAVGRIPRRGWPVLLRDPFGGFAAWLSLREGACSTSSTIGRPIVIGGAPVGDIIDPRTGEPALRRAQVTAIAASAAAAEAISTALLVLGREAVDEVARRMAADVCWIDRRGVHTTARFPLARRAS